MPSSAYALDPSAVRDLFVAGNLFLTHLAFPYPPSSWGSYSYRCKDRRPNRGMQPEEETYSNLATKSLPRKQNLLGCRAKMMEPLETVVFLPFLILPRVPPRPARHLPQHTSDYKTDLTLYMAGRHGLLETKMTWAF